MALKGLKISLKTDARLTTGANSEPSDLDLMTLKPILKYRSLPIMVYQPLEVAVVLDNQSRDLKIDPPFSGLLDET